MKILSTHLKLIKCLQFANYTEEELSFILNISKFKIKYHLKELEYFFNVQSTDELHKKLINNSKKFETLKKHQSCLPDERVSYIILNLLFYKIINLSKISLELEVSRRTASSDILTVKKILKELNLEIESYNSLGICLKGNEKDIRICFQLYLIKFFLEKDYLPPQFNIFLTNLNNLNRKYNIKNNVKKMLDQLGFSTLTFATFHIEAITYISLLRKDLMDDESLQINFKYENFIENIDSFFKDFNFYSDLEINCIKELCYLKDYNNLLTFYWKECDIIKNLTDHINLKFNYNIVLTPFSIRKLIVTIKLIQYKEKYNIHEFYTYNKDIALTYLKSFQKLSLLVKQIFKNIDSYDCIIMFIIYLEYMYKEIENKIENFQDIVVVYKFFNVELLINICKDLGFINSIHRLKFVSIDQLDEFAAENHINGILVFEDINFKKNSFKILKFMLPISKVDKIQLAEFFDL